MKIGFVVTAHWSDEYRKQGGFFLERFCNSLLEHCSYNFKVYVVDNASTYPLPQFDVAQYIRIEDQTIEGITGAWNRGLHTAYSDGCNILVNCNDDLWFNSTLNIFLAKLVKSNNSNIVYSALTNGVLGGPHLSRGPRAGVTNMPCTNWHNVINGFFFGLTRSHYEQFRYTETEYFPQQHAYNEGDGKWGGQEGYWIELAKKGVSGLIINEAFVEHTKLRGWKQLKNL